MATIIYPVRLPDSVVAVAQDRAKSEGTTLRTEIQRFAHQYAGVDFEPLGHGLAGASEAEKQRVSAMGTAAKRKKAAKRKIKAAKNA